MTPGYALGLYVVGYGLFYRARPPGLRNGQWTGMTGEKGRSYGTEHETGQQSNGQDVLGYLLSTSGLRRTKDDALDTVVDTAARLESVRGGCLGEVAEVGLQEPESLRVV
jgi:hypothetical protein